MVFADNDVLRAPALRQSFGTIVATVSDVTTSLNDTIMMDVPGISILLEPESMYFFDGYLAYEAHSTPSIKFGLIVPTAGSAKWTLHALTIPGPAANVEGIWRTETQQAGAGGTGTPTGMACFPHGYVQVANFAGPLLLQFAQQVSDAQDVTVRAGSWLRVVRIGDSPSA